MTQMYALTNTETDSNVHLNKYRTLYALKIKYLTQLYGLTNKVIGHLCMKIIQYTIKETR